MSIIGNFGLCSQKDYHCLVDFIKNNQLEEAENLMQKIAEGFEESSELLNDSRCSGEVYIAVFDYLKEREGIDIRKNEDVKKVSELWRKVIGGYEMIAFAEEEKEQLLSRKNTINYPDVIQYVNDFFAYDYEDFGQAACEDLLGNLGKTEEGNILIWWAC